jgi:2-methylcitrate dehydratase PrpD
VRDLALRCVVDWFAASLCALPDDAPAAARRYTRQWSSSGRAMSLYGDFGAAAPVALVNATLSHSADFDDLHFGSASHFSGPTLAATLAVAMERGCSESQVLGAFLTGYEVGATMGGAGVGTQLAMAGWHATGVLGHFSCVSAVAALLDLQPSQIANAVGLAATQAAGLQASGGTMAKPFHVGKAAMNGVMAAELALLGMQADATSLDDERNGILGCLFQAPTLARFDSLGTDWQIEDNLFKLYASCQLTHAPYEAARTLSEGFRHDGLREIRIHVNPMANKVAAKASASSPLEAKSCLGYCVALGLKGYAADLSGFDDSRVRDPDLQQLCGIARVVTAPGIERWAARIELDYGDGAVVRGDTQAVRGSPLRPVGWTDLDAKFIAATTPVLGEDAPRLLELLHTFDRPGRMAQAFDLVRGATARGRVPL